MQSSQIPVETRRSSNPLLDILPIRSLPNRAPDQGPSDFQKQLNDVRPPARPDPSKKSSSSPKNEKAKPRDSQDDSKPVDADRTSADLTAQETPASKPDDSSGLGITITPDAEIAPVIDASAQPVLSTANEQPKPIAGIVIPNKEVPSTERAIMPDDGHDASGKKFELEEVKPQPIPLGPPIRLKKHDDESDPTKGTGRAHPKPHVVHVDAKVHDAEVDANADQGDEPAPPVSATRANSAPKDASEPDRTSITTQAAKLNTPHAVDAAQNSSVHESIIAAKRLPKRDLMSDANDKLSSTKFAVANSDNDANSTEAIRPNSSAAVPVVRIAQATGDDTAASLGRWLVSPHADKTDKRGDSGSRIDVANATDTSEKFATASSVADAKNGDSVPRSTNASPVAFRVAELLGTDKLSTDNLDGVARSLSSSNGAGRHQVTLQLDPPELGRLRLDIRMEEGAMTLRVDAQTSSAAKLIESRMPDLRESLAVHGIRVDRTDIVVRSPDSGQSSQDHNPSQSRQGDPNQNSQHGFGEQSANSDTPGRGWFSQADSNRGQDHSPWSGFAPDTPEPIPNSAADFAADPTRATSVFIQPSLNLVA